jgi:hypothetical protein
MYRWIAKEGSCRLLASQREAQTLKDNFENERLFKTNQALLKVSTCCAYCILLPIAMSFFEAHPRRKASEERAAGLQPPKRKQYLT